MRIIITKDYEEMSAKAFEIMKGVVKNNPYAVLGLATGNNAFGIVSPYDRGSQGTWDKLCAYPRGEFR